MDLCTTVSCADVVLSDVGARWKLGFHAVYRIGADVFAVAHRIGFKFRGEMVLLEGDLPHDVPSIRELVYKFGCT